MVSGRHFRLASMLLWVLAVAAPLLVYQSFRNQAERIRQTVALRADLDEQRNLMIAGVITGRLPALAASSETYLERGHINEPLQGLPALPEPESFPAWCGGTLAPRSQVEEKLLLLLHDEENFYSGMPKRYGGMIEILNQRNVKLSRQDWLRLRVVTTDFVRAVGLDYKEWVYLLKRLPLPIRNQLPTQMRMAGLAPVPEPMFGILVKEGDRLIYLEAEERELGKLNLALRALNLEISVVKSTERMELGNLEMGLAISNLPPEKAVARALNIHLLIGLLIEAVILLLYGILRQGARIQAVQAQLLATTSHELRTPLAVIRQFAEMLVERGESFAEKHRKYHGFILRECLKMQYLVENLLSAAKFEHLDLKVNPTPFSPADRLRDMIAGAEPLHEGKEIRLTCTVNRVYWDGDLMERVFINLLENARNHAGTDVEIDIRPHANRVEIQIRDYGDGADLYKIRQVQAFNPGKASSSGLGLGLHLVDRIINAHSGSLDFEKADPGLRVRISLPVDPFGVAETEKGDPEHG